MTDGYGNHTGYALDGWGRITAVETAEGGREEYAYGPAGNITQTTDAGGGRIQYSYNSMGKSAPSQTSRAIPRPSGTIRRAGRHSIRTATVLSGKLIVAPNFKLKQTF